MGRSVLFMQTVSRSLTGSFRALFEWELARTPPSAFAVSRNAASARSRWRCPLFGETLAYGRQRADWADAAKMIGMMPPIRVQNISVCT